MVEIDPIFKHEGGKIWQSTDNAPEEPPGFYFWAEDWYNYYGPYKTYEEAKLEIKRYAKEILKINC